MMFGIGAINAFYGDREQTVFESSYPAFFFQIPEMNSRCSRGQPDTRSIADVGHKASSKQIQGVQTGKQMQGMQTDRRVQGVQANKGNKGQGQGQGQAQRAASFATGTFHHRG